jgi:5-methyltetrahydrofolate corrinoid/iron sulfur protein methyltransferase
VHKVMDGEMPNMASLTREQADYVKTVKVLKGETLYSHSWLEV